MSLPENNFVLVKLNCIFVSNIINMKTLIIKTIPTKKQQKKIAAAKQMAQRVIKKYAPALHKLAHE